MYTKRGKGAGTSNAGGQNRPEPQRWNSFGAPELWEGMRKRVQEGHSTWKKVWFGNLDRGSVKSRLSYSGITTFLEILGHSHLLYCLYSFEAQTLLLCFATEDLKQTGSRLLSQAFEDTQRLFSRGLLPKLDIYFTGWQTFSLMSY